MKFLIVFALFVAVAFAAPQKNPCSTVNGKTHCTGLVTPPPATPAKNPCSTVNGKTYCTGLVTPAPAPSPAKNPCSTVNGKTYCTGFIPAPGAAGH